LVGIGLNLITIKKLKFKLMKNLYSFLFALMLAPALNAQLVDVITEVVANGPLGEIPAGYSTYRVYALLADPDDRVSAVYGSSSPSPAHRLYIGSSEEEPSIWNSTVAGTTGSDNSCAVWSVIAETEFDSYVTVGLTSAANDACPDCDGIQTLVNSYANPIDIFTNSFGTAFNTTDDLKVDLFAWDGTYLLDNTTSCNGFGQAPDNRVILAQVTVPTATLEFCLNIVVLDGGITENATAYVHDVDDAPGDFGPIEEVDGSALGLCFSGEIIENVAGNGLRASEFSVVPNPSQGNVVLSTSGSEFSEVQVYNITGQCILYLQGLNAKRIELPAENWQPGVYVVEARNAAGLVSHSSLVVE
jgi:hypothetical protein